MGFGVGAVGMGIAVDFEHRLSFQYYMELVRLPAHTHALLGWLVRYLHCPSCDQQSFCSAGMETGSF